LWVDARTRDESQKPADPTRREAAAGEGAIAQRSISMLDGAAEAGRMA